MLKRCFFFVTITYVVVIKDNVVSVTTKYMRRLHDCDATITADSLSLSFNISRVPLTFICPLTYTDLSVWLMILELKEHQLSFFFL